MAEPPAYVSLGGLYARRIRTGELPPGVQLPSNAELQRRHEVSEIVVRKALGLLQSQGLVRTVRGGGAYVTDEPNLVRISPERQLESPEAAFGHEAGEGVKVDRNSMQVTITDALVEESGLNLAEEFGLASGDKVTYTVTRTSKDGRPLSISDTYQPLDVADISRATTLEETVTDELPSPSHAEWLRTRPGDLIQTIRQRFLANNGRAIMISTVTYPRGRYRALVFRMALPVES